MTKHSKPRRTFALPPTSPPGDPGSGGQSGDTQGLPSLPASGSESVRELVEEGQNLEASLALAIENAEDPDVAELHLRELPLPNPPAPTPKARPRKAT